MENTCNKVEFYVTGFGPFHNITENPTSILVNSLIEQEKNSYNIISAEVLEVSTVAVKEHFS